MSITHIGNLHFSWYFFLSISTQFSKVQIRFLVHQISLAWAYDKHIKCFLRKTLTQICNLQIRIVHFYKNYSPLMTPSDAKGHQSSHAVYRVSQKNALSESSSWKLTPQREQIQDVLNLISLRCQLAGWGFWKCVFFGTPCICIKWFSALGILGILPFHCSSSILFDDFRPTGTF